MDYTLTGVVQGAGLLAASVLTIPAARFIDRGKCGPVIAAAVGCNLLGIRPFPLNWDMSKQLGEFAYNKKVWDEHTVINQIDKIENGDLAIIIDCGEADFFLN